MAIRRSSIHKMKLLSLVAIASTVGNIEQCKNVVKPEPTQVVQSSIYLIPPRKIGKRNYITGGMHHGKKKKR